MVTIGSPLRSGAHKENIYTASLSQVARGVCVVCMEIWLSGFHLGPTAICWVAVTKERFVGVFSKCGRFCRRTNGRTKHVDSSVTVLTVLLDGGCV